MMKIKSQADVFSQKKDEVISLIRGDDEDFKIYEMNPIASEIWPMLIKGATQEELLEYLVDNFEAEEDEIERDLNEFLNELLELKLIQKT